MMKCDAMRLVFLSEVSISGTMCRDKPHHEANDQTSEDFRNWLEGVGYCINQNAIPFDVSKVR